MKWGLRWRRRWRCRALFDGRRLLWGMMGVATMGPSLLDLCLFPSRVGMAKGAVGVGIFYVSEDGQRAGKRWFADSERPSAVLGGRLSRKSESDRLCRPCKVNGEGGGGVRVGRWAGRSGQCVLRWMRREQANTTSMSFKRVPLRRAPSPSLVDSRVLATRPPLREGQVARQCSRVQVCECCAVPDDRC